MAKTRRAYLNFNNLLQRSSVNPDQLILKDEGVKLIQLLNQRQFEIVLMSRQYHASAVKKILLDAKLTQAIVDKIVIKDRDLFFGVQSTTLNRIALFDREHQIVSEHEARSAKTDEVLILQSDNHICTAIALLITGNKPKAITKLYYKFVDDEIISAVNETFIETQSIDAQKPSIALPAITTVASGIGLFASSSASAQSTTTSLGILMGVLAHMPVWGWAILLTVSAGFLMRSIYQNCRSDADITALSNNTHTRHRSLSKCQGFS